MKNDDQFLRQPNKYDNTHPTSSALDSELKYGDST